MTTTGEFLMRKFLDIQLRGFQYIDNFRPEWLTNPATGQPLEIDRYYPRLKVGFEFQGEYHLRPVPEYGSFEKRLELDGLKNRLSKVHGVKLLYVEPIDLTRPRINALVKAALRHYRSHSPETKREINKSGKYKKKIRQKRRVATKANAPELKFISQDAIAYRKRLNETYPAQVGTHRRGSMARKNNLLEHGVQARFSRKQLEKLSQNGQSPDSKSTS